MISAILLAAGQSKRIPKENKLLKKFKGKTLINHILNQLIKSKVKKIIIVLGHEHSLVKKAVTKNKKIQFILITPLHQRQSQKKFMSMQRKMDLVH